ncbi:hypothetical protein ACFUJR_19200 [Streptomyces sp. NPDC057271]|uniref:hypothetical protein n=1 Tax=unclassified Streptomyces TaxID=2593676 RepID=UPI0036374B7C
MKRAVAHPATTGDTEPPGGLPRLRLAVASGVRDASIDLTAAAASRAEPTAAAAPGDGMES